jgi:hypothetical protein
MFKLSSIELENLAREILNVVRVVSFLIDYWPGPSPQFLAKKAFIEARVSSLLLTFFQLLFGELCIDVWTKIKHSSS